MAQLQIIRVELLICNYLLQTFDEKVLEMYFLFLSISIFLSAYIARNRGFDFAYFKADSYACRFTILILLYGMFQKKYTLGLFTAIIYEQKIVDNIEVYT